MAVGRLFEKYFYPVKADGIRTNKPVVIGATATVAQPLSLNGVLILTGSGAPTASAAQGSLYLRTDGSSVSTRLYVNTNGSTTWTNVTTAA